jgi:hypothetical protein
MLRFLTDELQDAEDQGDRGTSFFKHNFPVTVIKLAISLDYGSRSKWLGWY